MGVVGEGHVHSVVGRERVEIRRVCGGSLELIVRTIVL